MSLVQLFVCTRCRYRGYSVIDLFRHFTQAHSHEDNWYCGLEGCSRTYRLYYSFSKHAHRYLKHLLGQGTSDSTSESQVHATTDDATEGSTANISPSGDVHRAPDINDPSFAPSLPEAPCSCDDDAHSQVHQLSLLLLKWKEARKLPESTVDEIASDLVQYIEEFHSEICSTDPSVFKPLTCRPWS